jgi:hypothetical protein
LREVVENERREMERRVLRAGIMSKNKIKKSKSAKFSNFVRATPQKLNYLPEVQKGAIQKFDTRISNSELSKNPIEQSLS